MGRRLAELVRYETALIAPVERAERPFRLAAIGLIAAALIWLGKGWTGLTILALVAAIEITTPVLYRSLQSDPARFSLGTVVALWSLNVLSTMVYLSPGPVLAAQGELALSVLGVLWVMGVFVFITNSFHKAPLYCALLMAPGVLGGFLVFYIVAATPPNPGKAIHWALVLLVFLTYVYANLESLILQAKVRDALTSAKAEGDRRMIQLEAALAARVHAEKRFHDIATVSRDWFWEIDQNRVLTYLGDSFQASTGVDPARVLGRRLDQVGWRAGGPIQADWARLQALLDSRTAFGDFLVGFPAPQAGSGSDRTWLRLAGTPILSASGAFAGFRGVASDVTPYLLATERAEGANHAKSQFLAVMSHELRTPLTAVLGMAELLRDRVDDPPAQEMIDTIRSAGEGLLAVLNDVLDLAKIEAAKLDLEPQPFLPVTLLHRIDALLRARAEMAGLTLLVEAGPGLDRPLLGDANRILQILTNLVSNAIKFTASGSVRIHLAADAAGTLQMTVADQGIGMTAEQLSRVFEEFEQADSTIARRFGGTGLGLSITRKLVTLMKGHITADSTPGRGSRFQVVLPLAPTRESDAAAADGGMADGAGVMQSPDPAGTPTAAATGPTTGTEAALVGLRVLFADDTRTNRMIMQAHLSRLGVIATIAEDGTAALAAYRPDRFDLLLLDVSMPGLDGPATLAAIRASDPPHAGPPPPAIAVTAHAMRHQIDGFLAQGFAGHVAKPFNRAALAAEMLRLDPRTGGAASTTAAA